MTAPKQPRVRLDHRTVLVAAAVVAAINCGSSGSADGTQTGPTQRISIALDPGAATVVAGASTSFTVRVTGTNGFVGPATIDVSSAPNGVTTTIAPSQLSGSVTTTTVTVVVGLSVTAGSYSLVVSGSGAGVTGVSGSFVLTVTPAQTGGYALATSSPAVSLVQGSNASVTVALTRTGGFSGTVLLSVSGTSSGLSATLTPASVAGNSTKLTLNATTIAAPVTATLKINGSAPGVPDQSTDLQVTVTAAATGGSGDAVVDFSNCQTAAKPVWFAYQDGTGPWTGLVSETGAYRFTFSSAGASYAYATTTDNDHSRVTVTFMSRSELTAAPIVVCPGPSANNAMAATVAAVGASQGAFVSLGGSTVEVPTSGVASIPNVPSGTYDLVGWRFNSARGINTASDSRAVIVRDVSVAAGQSAGTIDFGAANAILPATWAVSFDGAAPGDAFTGTMAYYTGPTDRCVGAVLYNFANTSPMVPAGTYGIPESAQRESDFHVLSVIATNPPNTRVAQASFHLAGRLTLLRLQDAIPAPLVTDLGAATYKRLSVAGSTPAIYSSTMTFSYSDAVGARTATMQATIKALGGNGATLSFPDLSAAQGWNPSWMPATATLNWTFGGSGATYSGLPCSEGAASYAAFFSGSK